MHDKAPGVSGVHRHVEAAAQVLREAGHDVTAVRLVCPTDRPDAGDSAVFPATFRPWAGWRWAPALGRLLAELRPDVVHLHGGFTSVSAPLLRALRTRVPTVGIVHDVSPFCYLGTRRYRMHTLPCDRRLGVGCVSSGCYAPRSPAAALRHVYQIAVKDGLLREWRRLPHLVVPCAYLRELALQHGFAPERVTVVNHFVAPLPAPAAAPSGVPMVLYAGRLDALKGPQVLLEALRRLADLPWRCVIAGDGPDRAALLQAATAAGLGERVAFAGALSGAELDGAFAACNVLALPSLLPEAFGLSGLEALAHGRPVVGFPLGGVTEWLHDGKTGLVARPGSAESLAERLGALLRDPALARRLGANGRRLAAERFSPQRFCADIAAVHAAVGASPPRQGAA